MKFDITVLLDRSGSMQSRKDDHIGGIKSFIKDQQKQEGETKFTFIQFDSTNPFEIIFDGVDIQDINIDNVDLIPRNWTPLLDAVGMTVAHIEKRIQGKEKENQVVLLIVTDGAENASKEWTKERISKAIKDKENDWKILYLGANVDSFSEASSIGLQRDATVNYANSAAGANAVYLNSASKINTMRGMYHRGLEKTSVVCDSATSFTSEDRLECAADDQNLVNQVIVDKNNG